MNVMCLACCSTMKVCNIFISWSLTRIHLLSVRTPYSMRHNIMHYWLLLFAEAMVLYARAPNRGTSRREMVSGQYMAADDPVKYSGYIAAIDYNGLPGRVAGHMVWSTGNCIYCRRLRRCLEDYPGVSCQSNIDGIFIQCTHQESYDHTRRKCLNLKKGWERGMEALMFKSVRRNTYSTYNLTGKPAKLLNIQHTGSWRSQFAIRQGSLYGVNGTLYVVPEGWRSIYNSMSRITMKNYALPVTPIVFRPFISRVEHTFRYEHVGNRTIELHAWNGISQRPHHVSVTSVLAVSRIKSLRFECPTSGELVLRFNVHEFKKNFHVCRKWQT